MANRPRRSRSGSKPGATIDLDAERVAAPNASPASPENEAPVDERGTGAEAVPTENVPEVAEDPVVASAPEEAASGPAPKTESATEEPEASAVETPNTVTDEDARKAVEAGTQTAPDRALDDTHGAENVGETPPDAAEKAAGPVEQSPETAPSDAEKPEGAAATTAEFARDEGFAGPSRPRPDLGEFEDDETVLHAAEPEHTGPDPLETSPYRPRNEVEQRGAGFGSLLGAALLGGAIALGAGSLLVYSGAVTLPVPRTVQSATPQYATAGDLQKVTGDVSTLRDTVTQLQSAQAAGGTGSNTVPLADFTALSDRVGAAERAIQSGGASSGDAADAAAKATDTANAARDTANEATNLANQARDTANAAQSAAQSADQAAKNAAQAAQNAQSAANEMQQSVDGFEQRLTAIEEANRQAATALAAAGLKAAIDRGGPFMTQLERFANTSNGNGTVDALRAYAASGVPTVSALNNDWQATETAILQALQPEAPAGDVGQQVLSGLRSLVTVRPAGTTTPQSAPGPQATVARMDAAISSGNFADWLQEWNTLPDAAKNASGDFADQVRARVEADRIIDESINSAIGAPASQG